MNEAVWQVRVKRRSDMIIMVLLTSCIRTSVTSDNLASMIYSEYLLEEILPSN